MKMKKIFAAFAAAAMLCGLTACNNGEKVYTVGICQAIEHPALDQATAGFKEALIAKFGGEDKIKFDTQNAQGESTQCTTIVTNFVSSGVDLIMANATGALTAAASATDTIPIVGTSITAYDVAFDGTDWKGKNITGASDLAPLEEQENMLVDIFPDAKTVGIMYCSSEPNSVYQAQVFGDALKADGITVKEYTVVDSNDIQQQTQAACGECDVIYIPTDNTLANAAEAVRSIVVPAKVPVVAGEEGICSGCGTVTLSISYHDMGYAAGEMAYEILANGKKPGEMEIGYSPVTKLYNKSICEELGVTVPDDYKAIEGT
ncbi:MAG: ABC transporter substrate-binding protein [Lachnospiraceae bacterium]|nr:ABC transporter substrate-binding protein [Ruminococcus sp.]MCM1273766.1 ABC transporter substrate-binding protein [Lachnospiraceae bacterium]